MVKELNAYHGRDQQMKGVVTNNTQMHVFGAILPRGHGHRGRLSSHVNTEGDWHEDVAAVLRNHRAVAAEETHVSRPDADKPAEDPPSDHLPAFSHGRTVDLLLR